MSDLLRNYGPCRVFQAQLHQLAIDIGNGARGEHEFVLDATPGGGKTRGYSIFAHELMDQRVVDQVIIVVPRDSLRTQVCQGFTDPPYLFRAIVDDPKHIRTGQGSLLARSGFVTTYQAIVAEPRAWLRRVKKMRSLLILDEGHHLAERISEEDADGATFFKAVSPMVAASEKTLIGSGTLWRHDQQPIPWVRYESGQPVADIRYTRRDALAERAIVPINFQRIDGSAIYAESGKVHDVTLSAAKKSQRSKALRSLLMSADYRDEIVLERLNEWRSYVREVYASKAIVIAPDQPSARHLASFIRQRLGVEVSLAISAEGTKGRAALKSFRIGKAEVLVTVAMAHEGLDVPEATHLICLSATRSKSWIEQAFNRVTRFNRTCGLPWEQQYAYIYVPDDPDMRVIIDQLMSEQYPLLKDRQEMRDGHGRRVHPASTFRPIDAKIGLTRFATVDGCLSDVESRAIDTVHAEFPHTASWPHREVLKLADRLGVPLAEAVP